MRTSLQTLPWEFSETSKTISTAVFSSGIYQLLLKVIRLEEVQDLKVFEETKKQREQILAWQIAVKKE